MRTRVARVRKDRPAFEVPTSSYKVGALHLSDKYTIEALGFALIAIGALLFLITLYTPTATSILLVIVGIILLILARDMKPKQESDAR